MTAGERLKTLRKRIGSTQIEFAESLGFTQTYLSQVERKKGPIPGPLLEKINQVYPNVSLNWILNGIGSEFLLVNTTISNNTTNNSINNLITVPEENTTYEIKKDVINPLKDKLTLFTNPIHNTTNLTDKNVTFLSDLTANLSDLTDKMNIFIPVAAQAGYLHDWPQEAGPHLERVAIPGISGEARTIPVSGDSMVPYLHDGDLVVCTRHPGHSFDRKHIYLIVSNVTGLVLKFIERKNDFIIIHSSNPALYPSQTIHEDEVKEIWVVETKITRHISPTSDEDRISKLEQVVAQLLSNQNSKPT